MSGTVIGTATNIKQKIDMNIIQIDKEVRDEWKMASYGGMYKDLIKKTKIKEKTLRNAILHGIGTEKTIKAINKFFASKKQLA